MAKQPNIIIFMTDQQAGSTLLPESEAITPNLDKFRNQGMHFRKASCVSPHCCPSRASFFSGLYPSEHGVWNNVLVDNTLSKGLFEDVTLFPELLKGSGYHTMYSGKWHVSAYENPIDRGFDEERHVTAGKIYDKFEHKPQYRQWKEYEGKEHDLVFESTMKSQDGQILRTGYPNYRQYGSSADPFGDQVTVSEAISMLETESGPDPYLLYVGPLGPHDPYFPPQRFIDLYKDTVFDLPDNFEDDMLDKPALYRRTKGCFKLSREEHMESIRRYMAFVSYEDYLFGQLLDAIERKGDEDTYVFYLSDHGDYMGAHGLWAKGLPCFKEAYDICAVVRGPGVKAGTTCDQNVTILDFAPTILELAGIESPRPLSGISLVSLFSGPTGPNLRPYVCTQTNGNEIYGMQRAIWNDKWKYVMNFFDYDELYDLSSDPGELHNLIDQEKLRPVVKELSKEIWKFAKDRHDNCTSSYIMVSNSRLGYN